MITANRRTILAGLALLLAGCATQQADAPVKAYSGMERPAEELAVVRCGLSTRLLAIDGDDRFLGQAARGRFSLLPGEHAFRVDLAPNAISGLPGGSGPRTIRFELEAGHVYDISVYAQPVDGRPWGVVVTDRTSETEIINPYLALEEDPP